MIQQTDVRGCKKREGEPSNRGKVTLNEKPEEEWRWTVARRVQNTDIVRGARPGSRFSIPLWRLLPCACTFRLAMWAIGRNGKTMRATWHPPMTIDHLPFDLDTGDSVASKQFSNAT